MGKDRDGKIREMGGKGREEGRSNKRTSGGDQRRLKNRTAVSILAKS